MQLVTQGKLCHCQDSARLKGLQLKGTPDDPLFYTMTSIKYQKLVYCLLLKFSNEEIATFAELTLTTVKTYKHRINFLGSPTTAALTAYVEMAKEFGRREASQVNSQCK